MIKLRKREKKTHKKKKRQQRGKIQPQKLKKM